MKNKLNMFVVVEEGSLAKDDWTQMVEDTLEAFECMGIKEPYDMKVLYKFNKYEDD